MPESLFPGWSNPAALTVLIGLRIGVNLSLTAMSASVAGAKDALTAVAGGATIVSALIVLLVLRPGGLGLYASYIELAIQVGLLGVVGYSIFLHTSLKTSTTVAYAVSTAFAVVLMLMMLPVYGEAFVAP